MSHDDLALPNSYLQGLVEHVQDDLLEDNIFLYDKNICYKIRFINDVKKRLRE